MHTSSTFFSRKRKKIVEIVLPVLLEMSVVNWYKGQDEHFGLQKPLEPLVADWEMEVGNRLAGNPDCGSREIQKTKFHD